MFPVIWTYHPLPAQHESRNVISLSLGTSKIPQTEQNDSQTDNTYSIPPVLNDFPLKYYSQWGKESHTVWFTARASTITFKIFSNSNVWHNKSTQTLVCSDFTYCCFQLILFRCSQLVFPEFFLSSYTPEAGKCPWDRYPGLQHEQIKISQGYLFSSTWPDLGQEAISVSSLSI